MGYHSQENLRKKFMKIQYDQKNIRILRKLSHTVCANAHRV